MNLKLPDLIPQSSSMISTVHDSVSAFCYKPEQLHTFSADSIEPNNPEMECGSNRVTLPPIHHRGRFSMARSFLALLLLSPGLLSAATLYCGPSSSGNGSGSDFNNRMALPNTTGFVRGNTYVIIEGNYGSKTFSTAASGTSVITIRKGNATQDSAVAGWASSLVDGQAIFGGGITFSTSYWIFDGVTGGGPGSWTSGHGFLVTITGGGGKGIILSNGPDQIQIRHTEVYSVLGTDTESGEDGLYDLNGSSYITLAYCSFHDFGRTCILTRNADHWLAEYCYFARNSSSAAQHSEGWSDQESDDMVVRYNFFETIEGTAFIAWLGADKTVNRWEIYGNVFWKTRSEGVSGVLRTRTGNTANNMKIYNNTIANVDIGSEAGVYINFGSGNTVYNNISYNSRPFNVAGATAANNLTASSGSIFVNAGSGDFRLSGASAGGSLGSGYNSTDAYGNTRGADGTWDRGAYEYTSGGGASAPIVTSQPLSTTVAAGQTATFSVTATGSSPMSYQWQRNGDNISGAMASTYTTPATTASDNGATFRAVVSNSGGSVTSAVATLTVSTQPNASPTVQITSPSSGANFTSPATITFEVSAADADGTIAKVEFFNAGTKLGEDSSSPYAFIWSGVAVGSYNLTATATDNLGAATTSSVISITVDQSPPTGQFNIGDQVVVTSEPSLRVRSTPEVAGTILGTQPYQAVGTIVSGPVSADGFIWWQVDYASSPDGWSIEGDGTTFFLDSAPPPPSPPSIPRVVLN
ncbi:MAG: hypothetical protein KIS67_21485 [Verrucomicrobiae bacterium]|nr:hypothetical protein [Verrucomicrobiae bacterium]